MSVGPDAPAAELDTPGAELDARLLGPVTLLVNGAPIAINGSRRRTAVALLVANRGRVVSTDAIADAIWEDALPANVKGAVQVVIFELRKILDDAGVAGAQAIRTAAPGYRLALDADRTDVGRFRALRREASDRAAAGRLASASDSYRAALAEWAGPACADLRGNRFADDLATELEEERLAVREAVYRVDLDLGRHDDLVPELTAAVAEHPLREATAASFLTALYRCGRQADALAYYRHVRDLLDDELGIDPGPELQALHAAILAQQPIPPTHRALPGTETTPEPDTEVDGAGVLAGFLELSDGGRIPLTGTSVGLGRSPDNSVVLDDAKASRHHAVVSAAAGMYVVTDLHSTNGTFVNGDRVFGTVPLADGDELRLGNSVLRLRLS